MSFEIYLSYSRFKHSQSFSVDSKFVVCLSSIFYAIEAITSVMQVGIVILNKLN